MKNYKERINLKIYRGNTYTHMWKKTRKKQTKKIIFIFRDLDDE